MKKALISCLVFVAVSCGTPKDTFVIEGYVPSLSDSTMLILLPFGTQILPRVDTAYVLNGRFSFDYPTTGKGRVILMSREDIFTGTHLPIWVEPGKKATITGDNKLIYTWTVESSIPEQQEANRYKQASKKDLEELQQIRIESVRLMSASNSDEIKKRVQELRKQEDQVQYRIYDRTLGLLAKAEPSVIFMEELSGIALLIQHYEAYAALKDRTIEQYERLPEEMKNTPEGKKIRLRLFPPAKVNTGDRMADTEMVDLEGKTHHLSEYLGKYILLDFWAFWCGPCRMAMPELGEIAGEYNDKLTIIGICSDPEEQWAKATEELNITWVNLNAAADPEFNARYGINGIPYQVIISPEGIILGSWFGYGKGHIKKQLKNYILDLE